MERAGYDYFPRILVIDGDHGVSNFIAGYFRDNGNGVVIAPAGEEALERLVSFAPELVFLDITPPGAPGLDFLKRMRDSGAAVEVIVMTQNPGTDEALTAIRGGVCDVLVKPFRIEQMIASYDVALQRLMSARQTTEALREARLAISGLTKMNAEEKAELVRVIRDKIETMVYPHLDKLIKSAHDTALAENLGFLKRLLDSIVPAGGGASHLAELFSELTPAEKKIARMLMEGMSAQEIADSLNRSVDTVYTHQKRIRRRLGLTNTSMSLASFLTTPGARSKKSLPA